MREKRCFRENIEALNEQFPDRGMLSVADMVIFTGYSAQTVRKKYGFSRNVTRISKADLARQISAGGAT